MIYNIFIYGLLVTVAKVRSSKCADKFKSCMLSLLNRLCIIDHFYSGRVPAILWISTYVANL